MIKDYLESEDQDRLADLLVKWEDAFDAGFEKSAEELAVQFPHLTTALESQIESLKKTLWIKKDPGRKLTDSEFQFPKQLSGTIAERYQVEELIGTGGYGQVYRAIDLRLGRSVALKIGHSQFSSDLLMDEARRVARLKHPNIVGIYDVGLHNERVFLVFEFVEGKCLDEILVERKITTQESVNLLISIAKTLQHAHEQGFIHCDIKPGNILVDADQRPLIVDFGVAVTYRQLKSNEIPNRGTLAYMAPEQVANEIQLISPQTDLHALGVLLFELLTGELPYQAENETTLREEIILRKPKRLSEIKPDITQRLEIICFRCLEKHPADRFISAEELAQELRLMQQIKSEGFPAL